MTTFTVHAPPGDLETAIAADRLLILPEKMSWGALLVPWAWAPWNRAWIVLAGWVAVTVGLEGLDLAGAGHLSTILSGAFALWFALSAQDMRRFVAERRGFRLVDVVEADDALAAERRFLERLAAAPVAAFGPEATTAMRRGRDMPSIVGFTELSGGRP